jgi:hypothetical protein
MIKFSNVIAFCTDYLAYFKGGGSMDETLAPFPDSRKSKFLVEFPVFQVGIMKGQRAHFAEVYKLEKIRNIGLHYKFAGQVICIQRLRAKPVPPIRG